MIKEAINDVVSGKNLTSEEAKNVMNVILNGSATPAQIAALITALRMKGESVEEITGFAMAMRERSLKLTLGDIEPVDTCGTGGDGKNTFNISTAAAFAASGAGVIIAKHGNRSVSSKCGSADVLKELGVNIELGKNGVERCMKETGIAFLFAPIFHSAMKYATPPRREIGIRTIFNVLGPLTNPAGASSQLIGVYDKALTEILARVLLNLGSRHVLVVHSFDGLDELSITKKSYVAELKNGEVNSFVLDPEEYGFGKTGINELSGGSSTENARTLLNILKGEPGPGRDVVVLNAAAVILAADRVSNFRDGISAAAEAIDNGNALKKLEDLKRVSNAE